MKQSPQVLEWQQEAREQALTEAGRSHIKKALEKNVGPLPPDTLAAIDTLKGEQTLEHYFDAALNAKTLEDFQRILEQRNGD